MSHEWHTEQRGRLCFTNCSKCGARYDDEHMGRRCKADPVEGADISATYNQEYPMVRGAKA